MSAEGDETRAKILQYVVAYEGINLSGIIRGLGLGNNQANHHLRVLESAGQVWSTRDGRLLRYYSTAVSPHTPPESLPKPPHIYAPDGTPIQLLDLLDRLVRAPVDGLSGNLPRPNWPRRSASLSRPFPTISPHCRVRDMSFPHKRVRANSGT